MHLASTLALLLLAAEPSPRVEFTRMVAHWAEYGTPDYLDFLAEAKPEIAQVGFYGGHFYSLVHTPQYKGYPAHFPVQGIKECGSWFEQLNRDIHQRGIKVVGHFNVEFLVGEPEGPDGPRGFFDFYRNHWDEKQLGPRPVADPTEFLMRNADGSVRAAKSYSIGGMREYSACLNNPAWRSVLKAWVKVAIDRGVDGLIANYFYRHNCLCPHCVSGFKSHLRERHTADELQQRYGIANLEKHQFSEIVGWHDPKESTPLRREMLAWSQISCKQAFDEVFIRHGRSLKPDLIVGQWNHLGNFHQISGDERCLLPSELWGRGEDYLWYSTGGAAHFTDLAAGVLGEGTLQARYIRGAFDDKPFTLGKYENTRTRVTIAELAANGGAPFGFYARHRDPLARQEITRYFAFLGRHDALFRGNRSHAEVLLLYPRSRVHAGDLEAVERFKETGLRLLDEHVLFDVRPDEIATPEIRAGYAQVIDVGQAGEAKPLPESRTRVTGPKTVRISASRSAKGNDLAVHLVNYNRTEPEKPRSAGRGIIDEKPTAVSGVVVDLLLPAGQTAGPVTWATPESPEPVALLAESKNGRLRVTLPEFLVYGVVRVPLTAAK